jgi:hypothetical protein
MHDLAGEPRSIQGQVMVRNDYFCIFFLQVPPAGCFSLDSCVSYDISSVLWCSKVQGREHRCGHHVRSMHM